MSGDLNRDVADAPDFCSGEANVSPARAVAPPSDAIARISALLEAESARAARDADVRADLHCALIELVRVVKIAGGPGKLMRGVELGAVSWMVKCSDALAIAERAIAKAEQP